jgi:hypothetical protein
VNDCCEFATINVRIMCLYVFFFLFTFVCESGPNILFDATDSTSAGKSSSEIKDAIVASFAWVTKEGVLCEARNFEHVGFQQDFVIRKANYLEKCSRRTCVE